MPGDVGSTVCTIKVNRMSIIFCNPTLADNDDDGESAAGGRLAHLLQILVGSCFDHLDVGNAMQSIQDIEEVLVIVTRYYGGVQLGPDRFK
jgi:hypothetical protein